MNFEKEKDKPLFIVRRPKEIAVDFDKTLHSYHKGWHDGSVYGVPIDGAPEAMRLLKAAGYRLIIFSCRNYNHHEKHTGADEPSQVEQMKAWMHKYEIPYDDFWTSCAKPPSDMFIDDKGLRFEGDWSKTVDDVFRLLPPK